MDKESFENLCLEEIRKTNGLYDPADIIEININAHLDICPFYVCYRSAKYLPLTPLDDLDMEETTGIDFHNLDNKAVIEMICVRKDMRRSGFGRGMVEAVEKIFSQVGYNQVQINTVDNPEFWQHMGFSLVEDNGHGDIIGLKQLNSFINQII